MITSANRRRDGLLPMDVEGVAETFGDELTLLGALQLRWHTRLAGRIERELMLQPLELEDAVVAAWHAHRRRAPRRPGDHRPPARRAARRPAIAEAMAKAAAKEQILLAMMAGRVSAPGAAAVRVGAADRAAGAGDVPPRADRRALGSREPARPAQGGARGLTRLDTP